MENTNCFRAANSRQPLPSVVRVFLAICLCVSHPVLSSDQDGVREQVAGSSNFSDLALQKQLKATVQTILPEGWGVSNAVAGSRPAGWHSAEPDVGCLIEASNGTDTARIWFLPRDWIGIHKARHDERSWNSHYDHGILLGERYKIIFQSTDQFVTPNKNVIQRIPEAIRKHREFGSTPSIVNSGWHAAEDPFRGRFDLANDKAKALIDKYCLDDADRDEAAFSLLVLGIPAKKVFMQAARTFKGPNKDLFCHAVGLMGGEDAVDFLCELIGDTAMADSQRVAAAVSLKSFDNVRMGPALFKAIKEVSNDNEQMFVELAIALGRARYKPAAPELLRILGNLKDDYYKPDVAMALASLDCKEAIPLIKSLIQNARATEARGRHASAAIAELALFRLTGEWGKPNAKARLAILPPTQAAPGNETMLTVYVENASHTLLWPWDDDQPRKYALNIPGIDDGQPGFGESAIIIDGKRGVFGGIGGFSTQLYPGGVDSRSIDIHSDINYPGQHTVQVVIHGAESNIVTLTVQRKAEVKR